MKREVERLGPAWERPATAVCVAAFIWIVGAAAASLACDDWRKVFEATSEHVHFAGVLSGQGAEWMAGGVGPVDRGIGRFIRGFAGDQAQTQGDNCISAFHLHRLYQSQHFTGHVV